MNKNPLRELNNFLTKLENTNIHYTLEHNREDMIMVLIAVPGERWEVEFCQDGTVEVERFISTGGIEGKELLKELFLKFKSGSKGGRAKRSI